MSFITTLIGKTASQMFRQKSHALFGLASGFMVKSKSAMMNRSFQTLASLLLILR